MSKRLIWFRTMKVYSHIRCVEPAPCFHFQLLSKVEKGCTTTHSHAHNECFIKLLLSSKIFICGPRRQKYGGRWRPAYVCGSISEIRAFREIRTERERYRKREEESAQPKVKEQIMKERQEAQSEDKRDSFRSVSLVSFLDLEVINEQIRTVLHKCNGEIKQFWMI